jgi:hypothetical protein
MLVYSAESVKVQPVSALVISEKKTESEAVVKKISYEQRVKNIQAYYNMKLFEIEKIIEQFKSADK